MKKTRILGAILLILAVGLFVRQLYEAKWRERTVVILSTNDIHARLDNFARLATAVERCRDTVQTVLTDSGDRWTGNAFVDMAEGRLPIIDLMNELGYTVVTLGNHEFDCGTTVLKNAIDHSSFATICANMRNVSTDLPTPAGHFSMRTYDGVRLCFVGVVNNDDYGHPDGSHPVFEGLEFSNAMEAARQKIQQTPKCDVKVLLSHMSLEHDVAFAEQGSDFDIILGGHSHDVADLEVGSTVIGQTGRRLKYVGATTIRMRGRSIESIDYRNIPLEDYPEDPHFAARVAEIENNPELKATVGTLAETIRKPGGLPNLLTELMMSGADAQIGFYHYGGIRKDVVEAGDISRAVLFDIDPFGSTIYRLKMTPAEMRNFIILKYNDTGNPKEAHRIDLFCSTPYEIVTDANDMAFDVRFPKLKEGKVYTVGMCNYIAEKYAGLNVTPEENIPTKVLDLLIDRFENHSPVTVDGKERQSVVVRNK